MKFFSVLSTIVTTLVFATLIAATGSDFAVKQENLFIKTAIILGTAAGTVTTVCLGVNIFITAALSDRE